MTAAHILFIPLAISVGIMIGFGFGARAARNAADLQRRRDDERARVRAERAARDAGAGQK